MKYISITRAQKVCAGMGVKMIEMDSRYFNKVKPMVESADLNTMFAVAVLERKIKGKVFIDDEASPASFYIQNPCGMSLLYGESKKEEFFKELADFMVNEDNVRSKYEYLQVYPNLLYEKVNKILGKNRIKIDPNKPYLTSNLPEEAKNVLEYQRINFLFHIEKYLNNKGSHIPRNYKIIMTTEEIFNELEGTVIPKDYWNNYNEFMDNGLGFTLIAENGCPISTAFASFTSSNKLEIGIETNEHYRFSGCAYMVCSHLIEYCITNGLEPVWSCNSANVGSRRLAEKLGFEEAKRVPYYRLAK